MTDADAAADRPILYLTGQYPKMSHTFIQREVAALRAHGAQVLTAQVRRAAAHEVAPDQATEAAATFTILEAARDPRRLVGAHLRVLRAGPRRWLAMLGLAWRTRQAGLRGALWQAFYFAEAGVLADHIRARGVGHLHNHFAGSSGTVAMLAAGLADIPHSFTEHGPDIFFAADRWRLDEKVARADFVVCISHFCRSQMMLFSDRQHWSKLRIVHCGIDPAAYGRRPREGFGQRILFVGRLTAVKGVPLLLEAVARVRAAHPGVQLTVVGAGDDRAGLEAQAAALGLGDAVRFAGLMPQDQVAARLEESDILVLPSFAEGVPVVLMEAMASRIPVIATRVGGVQELVADGESGFVVPPGCVDSLAGRLDALLGDPDLCRRMGEAGRRAVQGDFDTAREAGWLLALLRGTAPPGRLRPD